MAIFLDDGFFFFKGMIVSSTISPSEIALKVGNQEFPEIMNKTPGVYATKQGRQRGKQKMEPTEIQAIRLSKVVAAADIGRTSIRYERITLFCLSKCETVA